MKVSIDYIDECGNLANLVLTLDDYTDPRAFMDPVKLQEIITNYDDVNHTEYADILGIDDPEYIENIEIIK